jgi:phosphonate metabolism-associated iron-containing alcohol dehydrogenase
VVVGLGGGSALDTAKALGFVLGAGTPEALRQHFEHGAALPDARPLPLIAVPTTAGTGSEVTPFATIWDLARAKKYSLAGPRLYPSVALLDPTLTLSLPREVTVSTGLDALSQGFEAIWNRNATPITTLYALQAIRIAFGVLPRLIDAPDDLASRSQMLGASLLAGLAISRTRTALAHSISYPITARYGMPHGLACSFTLPAILEFNAAADDGRLARAAAELGCGSTHGLRAKLERLLSALRVGRLAGQYIRSAEDLLALAPEMLTPGRADNNMRPADVAQVRKILAATCGVDSALARAAD